MEICENCEVAYYITHLNISVMNYITNCKYVLTKVIILHNIINIIILH